MGGGGGETSVCSRDYFRSTRDWGNSYTPLSTREGRGANELDRTDDFSFFRLWVMFLVLFYSFFVSFVSLNFFFFEWRRYPSRLPKCSTKGTRIKKEDDRHCAISGQSHYFLRNLYEITVLPQFSFYLPFFGLTFFCIFVFVWFCLIYFSCYFRSSLFPRYFFPRAIVRTVRLPQGLKWLPVPPYRLRSPFRVTREKSRAAATE